MASFRKRNGKWQAQVRRSGLGNISRSFILKSDAQAWARSAEAELESGRQANKHGLNRTLGELLVRYRDEVIVHKRAHNSETRRVARLLKDPLSAVRLECLDPAKLAAFRDRRLQDGVRTCQYDLALIRHAFKIADTEWGFKLPENPVNRIRMPRAPKPRERRLEEGELERLQQAVLRGRLPWLWPLITLAIETAMRRGELLSLHWSDIDMQNGIAFLAHTKNGSPRRVPLSPEALRILGALPRNEARLFAVSADAVRQAWERVCQRAEIKNLHFHDLRHEAISRLFEMGLSVPEVPLVSGHKTPAQLFRYTEMRSRDVQRKLCRSQPSAVPPLLRLVKG